MSKRAHGVGRSTYEVGPDRKLRPNGDHPPAENDLWDLEVREDGGLRLFNARASDTSNGPAGLFGKLIGGKASTIIDLARRICSLTQFKGSWTFGVGITGLRSQRAHTSQFGVTLDHYSEDEYLEVHEADHHQLHATRSPVLDALIGRLCRSTFPHDQTPASLDEYLQDETN